MKKMFYLGAVAAMVAVNLLVISPSKAVAEVDPDGVPCNSTWDTNGLATTVDCLTCTRVDNIAIPKDLGTCTPK